MAGIATTRIATSLVAVSVIAGALVTCALVAGTAIVSSVIEGHVAGGSNRLVRHARVGSDKRGELTLEGSRGVDGRRGRARTSFAREHIAVIAVARDVAHLELRGAPGESVG